MKTKRFLSDWMILLLVTLISVGANLPDDLAVSWGINRNYLLMGLVAVIAVALLQYLRFSLFLVVVVMTLGANLPGEMAVKLNISPTAMLVALVVMVSISLFNLIWKVMPTGLEPKAIYRTEEGTRAMLGAIEKGNARMLKHILEMGVDANQYGEDGDTPLIHAVRSGNLAMVQQILKKKVDVQALGRDGHNAHDIALQLGRQAIAEAIRFALEESRQSEAATA